jgi:uncharacterized membrane protein YhaH (DUF805 family)
MWFFKSIGKCIGKYAEFHGRASRREFWSFFVFLLIIDAVSTLLLSEYNPKSITPILIFISVALIFPTLTAQIRRLHDIGKSGWWYLILFTGIGAFVLLYWFALPSQRATNEYGPPPAGQDNEPLSESAQVPAV